MGTVDITHAGLQQPATGQTFHTAQTAQNTLDPSTMHRIKWTLRRLQNLQECIETVIAGACATRACLGRLTGGESGGGVVTAKKQTEVRCLFGACEL